MPFLIKRTDQEGGYVQPPGSRKAYGPKKTARRYFARADAERDRCPDNETIEELGR